MTPKEMLKKLEAQLQEALTQADKVAKLKAEIANLKKLIADQDAGEIQYEKQYDAVVQDQTKKTAVADVQNKTVGDNTTAAERKQVDGIVTGVDGVIAGLVTALATAAHDTSGAWTKLIQKKAVTSHAQVTLAALKEPWKAAQKALKDAEALLTATDQQIAAKNYRVAYYLLKEIHGRIEAANLDTPKVYGESVSDATEGLFDATGAEQDAKDDFGHKTALTNTAQKAVDDAKSKRQDNIIKQVNTAPAAPAAPAAAPAPAVDPAPDC